MAAKCLRKAGVLLGAAVTAGVGGAVALASLIANTTSKTSRPKANRPRSSTEDVRVEGVWQGRALAGKEAAPAKKMEFRHVTTCCYSPQPIEEWCSWH